jgi:hypothetical protein
MMIGTVYGRSEVRASSQLNKCLSAQHSLNTAVGKSKKGEDGLSTPRDVKSYRAQEYLMGALGFRSDCQIF